MIGIEKLPIIDLGDLIDTEAYSEIDAEISLALIQSTELTYGTGGIYDSKDGTAEGKILATDYRSALQKLKPEQIEIFESLADPSTKNANASAYHSLSQRQRNFLKVVCGVYFSWQNSLILRGMDSFATKHIPTHTYSTEVKRLLPKTIDFINSLPFEQTGRIVIFGLDPLAIVPTHRDCVFNPDTPYSEFINISPSKSAKKGFYTYDAQSKKQFSPKTSAYWFNEADYHGAMAADHFNYSFRIDGVFTQEFRKAIVKKYPELKKILEHHPTPGKILKSA